MTKDAIETSSKAVINKLLEGEDIVLSELRKQWEQVSIETCELTGTGFYLTFSLPENISPLIDIISNVKTDFCFGDIGDIQNSVGFLLWVKDGNMKKHGLKQLKFFY